MYHFIFLSILLVVLPMKVSAGGIIPVEPPPMQAQPLKSGAWVISYYQYPNDHEITGTSNLCVLADGSWYIEPVVMPASSTQLPAPGPLLFTVGGKGDWLVDANNVTLYGAARGHQAVAFTAIGQLLGDSLVYGRYVNFVIPRNRLKQPSGSFQAIYQSEDCSF
ncbi:hypothetical protein [Methylomonas sp. AM2-LC]|uniref:hypothetical protein n=1 Tax=Methylomonas sp. AM2-LC TaxID=3153301 RepID=UPI003267485B